MNRARSENRFHHSDGGNESLQTVGILATGAIVLIGLMQVGRTVRERSQEKLNAVFAYEDSAQLAQSNTFEEPPPRDVYAREAEVVVPEPADGVRRFEVVADTGGGLAQSRLAADARSPAERSRAANFAFARFFPSSGADSYSPLPPQNSTPLGDPPLTEPMPIDLPVGDPPVNNPPETGPAPEPQNPTSPENDPSGEDPESMEPETESPGTTTSNERPVVAGKESENDLDDDESEESDDDDAEEEDDRDFSTGSSNSGSNNTSPFLGGQSFGVPQGFGTPQNGFGGGPGGGFGNGPGNFGGGPGSFGFGNGNRGNGFPAASTSPDITDQIREAIRESTSANHNQTGSASLLPSTTSILGGGIQNPLAGFLGGDAPEPVDEQPGSKEVEVDSGSQVIADATEAKLDVEENLLPEFNLETPSGLSDVLGWVTGNKAKNAQKIKVVGVDRKQPTAPRLMIDLQENRFEKIEIQTSDGRFEVESPRDRYAAIPLTADEASIGRKIVLIGLSEGEPTETQYVVQQQDRLSATDIDESANSALGVLSNLQAEEN